MRILVIGANGFLGLKILQYSKKYAKEDQFYGADIDTNLIPDSFPRSKLDITNQSQIEVILDRVNPNLVILTAAMTDVDACEDFKDKAYAINSLGPKYIAEKLQNMGSKLIFISTDFIFDGNKSLYVETDTPNPISYYGLTKLKAEEFIIKSGVEYCICRTSVLFGWPYPGQRDNFFSWAYKKLKLNTSLSIVSTQFNSPTLCDDLAICLLKLRTQVNNEIFHTCGSERIDRYSFVKRIAENFQFNPSLVKKTDSFPQKAIRPKDSSMDNAKIHEKIGISFKNIDKSLQFLVTTQPQ
jgi:dTDP-4-dehydrorhamnose reductase